MSEHDDIGDPSGDGLPACPRCSAGVQPDWDWCHACGFDPEGLRPAEPTPAAAPPSFPPPGATPPPAPGLPPGWAPPPPGGSFPPPHSPPPIYTLAPPAPPPSTPNPNRRLAVGLGIGGGAVAVLLLVAVLATSLIGTTSDPDTVSFGEVGSPSSPSGPNDLTATPDAGAGQDPGTIDTASGPCGPIPQLQANAGPADPTALISPAGFEALPLDALRRTYGELMIGFTEYSSSVDDILDTIPTDQRSARRQVLLDTGFLGDARVTHHSTEGDRFTILTVALRDTDAALDYAQFHLAQACEVSSVMEPSEVVPGGVVFYTSDPETGRPMARLVAVVGNTEVNVTLCTCHPDSDAMGTAEALARDIIGIPERAEA